jgi:hypothetical protein
VFSKKRRKSRKEVRKFIRKQLGFVKRNLTYIEKLLDDIESIKKQETLDEFFPIKIHILQSFHYQNDIKKSIG